MFLNQVFKRHTTMIIMRYDNVVRLLFALLFVDKFKATFANKRSCEWCNYGVCLSFRVLDFWIKFSL